MATTSYQIAILPKNGKIINFNSTTGQAQYVPNSNFMGIDFLTYHILCDGQIVDTARHTFIVALNQNNVSVLCNAYVSIAQLLALDYKKAEVMHILEEAFACIGIKCDKNAIPCTCHTST